MKLAFYLFAVYGALAYLAAVWGQAAIEKYREKHRHNDEGRQAYLVH